MPLSHRFRLDDSRAWPSTLSGLIAGLEKNGCQIAKNRVEPAFETYDISVPGLDFYVQEAFPTEWIELVRQTLWDRAQLRVDRTSRAATLRWVYWSPFQIATHALITFLFFLRLTDLETTYAAGPLLAAFGAVQLVPFAVSVWHGRRLRAQLEAAGFERA